jgi:hypothetical protein
MRSIKGIFKAVGSEWPFEKGSLAQSRGRCYDHNFLRFFPIFGENMAFFFNTNIMINFFQNLALFCVKNANFFAKFFGENI